MANGGLHPTSVGPRILQVVDQDGEFDESQVQSYMQDVGMEGAGPDYNVVSIMGPQSSGKSTLLNALALKGGVVLAALAAVGALQVQHQRQRRGDARRRRQPHAARGLVPARKRIHLLETRPKLRQRAGN